MCFFTAAEEFGQFRFKFRSSIQMGIMTNKKHTDISTYRLTRPRDGISENLNPGREEMRDIPRFHKWHCHA